MGNRQTTQEFILGPLPVDVINRTIDAELEAGDVVMSRAAQAHARAGHPDDFKYLPHLAGIIASPMYVGDDLKNRGIELIGRVAAANSFFLIAITMERDIAGRYNVMSFYAVSDRKIQSRRSRDFLRIAKYK